MKDTRTIQTLASVSLIGGPLSLLFGGVLLSIAALVCGIIALAMVRSRKDGVDETMSETIRQTLTRQAIIGIAMAGLALIMNAATLLMMLPAVLDAVQTGDYASLFGGGAGSEASSGSAGSGGAFDGNPNGSDSAGSQGPQSGRSSVWG